MAKGRIKNFFSESGQATIETVLLATILIGVFMFATKTMRDKKIVQKLTQKSVSSIKNMSEFGSWKDVCKSKGSSSTTAAQCHPNSIVRALSSDPK